ncbi:hypothetical protein FIV42_16540 [Persicimonas caeni]|uniref:Lipoprotein n=1 Tax=Persicimonas caeni TaxID=2292766 RepID=A0A4Y6PVE9_PERCE|nr:hypothetical protein [Persicimonas caeni]QDG52288.1 hypothetical protein FIV42_16540 [Persicimonas caeni]QED33510.1 hypothetical protein FRD00_16535 [Persicimonas caeni]
MMLRTALAATTLVASAMALSGCIELGEQGCTSDEECRGARVCAPWGACVDSARANLEPDAGTDADVPDTNVPDTAEAGPDIGEVPPYDLRIMSVSDECDGDLRTAQFVLRPGSDEEWCAEEPVRLVVDIEGALDLNSQTPGSTTLFADGISVTACEEDTCVGTDNGELTLDFYVPGEVITGRLVAEFQRDERVSQRISGQTYDLDIADLRPNWCAYADDECRF